MLPAQIIPSGEPPVVAAENSDFLQQFFGNCFNGFAPTARYLKARKADFAISDGGATTIVPNGQLYGVLLGVHPYNYCTWYEKEYVPGQEPSRPDLVWVQKSQDDYPDSFPKELRQKIMKNGRLMWAYKQARRTVWALCTPAQNGLSVDLDHPVVFDISSMSLYGKGDPNTHSYKWTGMRAFCQSLSRNGVMVTPSMFVTSINIDLAQPVSGVVYFQPCANNGRVLWLDTDTFASVVDTARSYMVESLLEVNEILGREGDPVSPPVSPRDEAPRPAPAQAKAPEPAPEPAKPTAHAEPATPASEPVTGSLLSRAGKVLGRNTSTQTKPTSGGDRQQLDDLITTLGL